MRISRVKLGVSIVIATALALSAWDAENQGSTSNPLRDFRFVCYL